MKLSLLFQALSCLGVFAVTVRGAEAPAAAEPVTASVLKIYDRDSSGDLSPEELARWEADKAARRSKQAEQRAEMLARYDTDGDGRISEAEKAAAKLSMQSQRTEVEKERIKQQAAMQAKAKAAAREAAAAGQTVESGAAMSAESMTSGETAPSMMQ